MKRLNIVFLITGASIVIFSCTKDNSSLTPDINQNDELTTSYKAKKIHTHFSGECTLIHTSPENAWYDNTDDARVTGVSIWESEPPQPIDDYTFELSGTAELFVGALNVGDEYDGKWETTWWGTMTWTSPDGSTFRIVAHAVGTGVEGNVAGLTARWKYTMNYDGTPETFKYSIKGKITEEL